MHTVRKTGRHWLVQYVENHGDPGYRPTRDNLVWFRSNWDAFKFCAFLNGGEFPSLSPEGLEDIRVSPTLRENNYEDSEK